ncbi:MAG: hypothetical protein JNL08_00035 [Planctomycetes bacterium]|nr:hypothetical protein [Planctomycetota bacterium]
MQSAAPRSVRRRSPLVAWLLAAGCSGPLPVRYFEELPAGSDTWHTITAEPSWVKAPPANAGHVRIVAETKSNGLDIAKSTLDGVASRALHDRVVVALRTVIPAPAATAAGEAASARMRLVQRACRDEVLTRDLVPGNTLATVWGLYEVPVADLLPHVPADLRAVAEASLAK